MLTYQKDGLDIKLEVKRAMLRDGILRSKLHNLQDRIIGEDVDSTDDWVWRSFQDCMSATDVKKGPALKKMLAAARQASKITPDPDKEHPLHAAFQSFLDLPEELIERWHTKVLEVNSHWAPWRQPEALEGEADSDVEPPSRKNSSVAASDD